jgi:hypothetical protein
VLLNTFASYDFVSVTAVCNYESVARLLTFCWEKRQFWFIDIMGIKGFVTPAILLNIANGTSRIYGEIGAGERIALSKLAIEKFEKTGRPLRIAIDISIWQFQIQAGQGEWRPARYRAF